jgi:hypothetical protein
MSMLADKAGGLGTLTFKYRRYGTAAQVDWRVDCSTNSGASWAQVGATFTAPANDTVQTFSAAVYATGGVRIRIRRATETGTSDRQLNIDDIVLTDHTAGANGLSIGGFTWNFDSLLPVALPTTVGIECGGISRGNNNGSSAFLTNSIPSTGYSGASGGTNGSARARGGALDTAVDGSAYLEFTLTPAPGVRAVLTDISFGARSTLTGPQAIAVYTGADGYTTPVADVLTAANNSVWALHAAESAFAFQRPTVFRVFGYNGTATTSTDNWRIDDLRVQVTTETIIPTLIRIH